MLVSVLKSVFLVSGMVILLAGCQEEDIVPATGELEITLTGRIPDLGGDYYLYSENAYFLFTPERGDTPLISASIPTDGLIRIRDLNPGNYIFVFWATNKFIEAVQVTAGTTKTYTF